ncbi:hypothetical protein FNF27_05214 [Cafeteria roenbergensis]|uniref:N-acetyltransferase domain-containing protein n=1 Tax=Cafeteria roenbergensis TaxID=33653 RepID=A0A5A8CG65_CAFRO|nr:hypothetical protein FNF29_04156 [Cafeteria roenbergensis]KAA0166284.1 hypothetical protein FNF31_01510 [Cafeteria roenbergensis]KAA0168162.1 hypothetical protein FNF28_02581 [Cafeteria roenbergensis]KAA0173288.1 hypothetical protein FNF27_05214 [Cafeteria roenbergensis]|eukprot:KAA0152042.1 hypothetical protein FNF29_04156 [Cafeteria roenbergensis]
MAAAGAHDTAAVGSSLDGRALAQACEKAGVVLRYATPADVPRVLELLEQLSPTPAGAPGPDALSMAAAIAERTPGTVTLLAVDVRPGATRGEVLGTCSVASLRRLARGGSMVARLEDVVTDKRSRGRGVAAALCEGAKAEAAKRGAYAIDLRCVPKLAKYYGKFGWTDAGCAMRCNL